MEFPQRGTLLEIEEGKYFMPRFDDVGLIPCVTLSFLATEKVYEPASAYTGVVRS